MKPVIITNLTAYRPEEVIDNHQIENDFLEVARTEINEFSFFEEKEVPAHFKHYGTHLEQLKRRGIADPIFHKVGIESRHTVNKKMVASDLAIEAGKELLKQVSLDPNTKTVVIAGTSSAEDRWPSVASKSIMGLGLTPENGFAKIAAYDISAACSSWFFAIDDAHTKIRSGSFKNGLVFSSDTMTSLVHKYDKSRILFGDGATASYLQIENPRSTGFRINATDIATFAQMPKDVHYPTNIAIDVEDEKRRNRMNLNGGKVYKAGIEYSAIFIENYLRTNGISLEEFDYIIPHQSNGSMLSALESRLNLGVNKYGKSKMISNIRHTGNTAASSIPLCLFDFAASDHFKHGDRILMCSFGAGYTLGLVDVEYKAAKQ